MDNGHVVEFDTPENLMKNDGSHFAGLVREMQRMERAAKGLESNL